MSLNDTCSIAHLSDPHLTHPTPFTLARLGPKRLLSYLSWRRKRRFRHLRTVLDAVVRDLATARPDHVLVTGDLTQLGLPDECGEARDWLMDLAHAQPVSVVPGNHDRLVDDDWSTTVGLWQAWYDGRARASGGPDAGRGGSFPTVGACGPVALVGLDSAVPTPLLLASGRIGAAQRARLADVLASLGRQGAFRLVHLHHSPLPDGHAWRKRLRDAHALLDVLHTQGAEMVVHGHGHHEACATLATAAGPMLVVGAPSASLSGVGRAGWNRYDIARVAGGWSVTVGLHRHTPDGMAERGCRTHLLTRTAAVSP